MTGDRALGADLGGEVDRGLARKSDGGLERTMQEAAPHVLGLLQLTLRAQVADGDLAAAMETAARLSRMPDQPDALDLVLDAALDTGEFQTARTALSEAGAGGTIPSWRAAYHKARIAFQTGDLLAARAILVLALDATPGNAPLRALLVEAMVAAGTASDARAVLGHIGSPPVNPAPEEAGSMTDIRTAPAAASSGPDPTKG